MNIVHLVVVETLSTLWNLEEPFTKISSFQSYLGTKILVKIGTQQLYTHTVHSYCTLTLYTHTVHSYCALIMFTHIVNSSRKSGQKMGMNKQTKLDYEVLRKN